MQLDAVRQDSVRVQAENSQLHLRLIQQAEQHDVASKQVRCSCIATKSCKHGCHAHADLMFLRSGVA